MGAMFRSEEMILAQLFMQPEAAYPTMSELGEIGMVQFRDLNEDVNPFQKKFVNEVRRCDEMDRKLRYIEAEIKKDEIVIPEAKDLPKAPNPRESIELEAHIEKIESEIRELSQSAVELKSNFLELTELRHVLEKTQSFFIMQDDSNADSPHKALIPEDTNVTVRGKLAFVAGVIDRERLPGFERMLWRISRGNIFLKQADIYEHLEDPKTRNPMLKTVFVAFFQGEQLRNRVKKICVGFHASMYPCPGTTSEREEMLNGVCTRLEDLNLVLNQTQDHRQRVLNSVVNELQNWSVMVRKMKAIYHTLNFFNVDVTKKCLIGECWIPTVDFPQVQKALVDGSNACGSTIQSFMNTIRYNIDPPTFNRTNKFTQGFQNLIDAYGVASYRECNPALYTILTFPFLFAVMFGDVGHGFILFLFGLFMVIFEKKLTKSTASSEIASIFFGGRYIILMMGMFSIYTGVIYNDIFSKSFNIFGTSWTNNLNNITVEYLIEKGHVLTFDPTFDYDLDPYPIGVDPIWQLAKNKIIFLNTYKMKLSIIFGVAHMMFGVSKSVVNYIHFRKFENIIFDFIPQMLFLMCLFLWMVVMMFMKFFMYNATNTDDNGDIAYGTFCAPSVLILFINMMLLKETKVPSQCKIYMFEGQYTVQMVLLCVALVCIPVLLLGKPLYILVTRKIKAKHVHTNGDVNQGMELQPEIIEEASKPAAGHHAEDNEPMSEIFIHQAIHTIEYALSTISHTASYLRLWALSLAHAQLSEVTWNMVFAMGLKMDFLYVGGVIIYFLFSAWSVLTIGILVMMEGLSAFLHTLRLHWVEFMSKFYIGLGYPFQPFCFKTMLNEEETEAD